MPRSKALQSVANTLAQMFVSRNNDAGGYWAIGRLYEQALRRGVPALHFELMPGQPNLSETVDIQIVTAHYQRLLREQIRATNSDTRQLARCQIVVEFDVPEDWVRRRACHGFGSPVACTVTATLLSGQQYRGAAYCRARPHDPTKESRRHEKGVLTIVSFLG